MQVTSLLLNELSEGCDAKRAIILPWMWTVDINNEQVICQTSWCYCRWELANKVQKNGFSWPWSLGVWCCRQPLAEAKRLKRALRKVASVGLSVQQSTSSGREGYRTYKSLPVLTEAFSYQSSSTTAVSYLIARRGGHIVWICNIWMTLAQRQVFIQARNRKKETLMKFTILVSAYYSYEN